MCVCRKNGRAWNQRRMLSTLRRVFICLAFMKTNFISLVYSDISLGCIHTQKDRDTEREKELEAHIERHWSSRNSITKTKSAQTDSYTHTHSRW